MEKKVLLVADDMQMNRTVIKKFMADEYTVLEAEDGQQAMDIMTKKHVDIVILDIIMPKMDGFEVLEAMKADSQYKDIGVLIATSAKEQTERKALSLGADDVASKPYDPIVISKRVENILDAKELLSRKRGYNVNANGKRTSEKSIMLIADDVESNRAILKEMFSKDFIIMEATNGTETVEIIESCQGNLDLVLLDLMMPGMDGFEVLENRKRIEYFRNIPVIVLTGSSKESDQIRAFELGVNDYIEKPFVAEIVLSRVKNVLQSHHRMMDIELEKKKLKDKSEIDQMTGLYNKTTAERLVELAMADKRQSNHALIVIDIDNFKSVNDLMGHLIGDQTIKAVANSISRIFRKSDIVARIGGDEFLVFMKEAKSSRIVRQKLTELMNLVKYQTDGELPGNVTLSAGFSMTSDRCISMQAIFDEADKALFEAKERGKARFYEFGVFKSEESSQPSVLLISQNRSTVSIVNSIAGDGYGVLDVPAVYSINRLNPKKIEGIFTMFVDVTDSEDDGRAIWNAVENYDMTRILDRVAICKEGNTSQMRIALENKVSDIITSPLDNIGLKRRIMRKLEEYTKAGEEDGREL